MPLKIDLRERIATVVGSEVDSVVTAEIVAVFGFVSDFVGSASVPRLLDRDSVVVFGGFLRGKEILWYQ
jgi:hypothetical protein